MPPGAAIDHLAHQLVRHLTFLKSPSGLGLCRFHHRGLSRFIVGWEVSKSLPVASRSTTWRERSSRAENDLAGLFHHSDRGSRRLGIRYSERLNDDGADAPNGCQAAV